MSKSATNDFSIPQDDCEDELLVSNALGQDSNIISLRNSSSLENYSITHPLPTNALTERVSSASVVPGSNFDDLAAAAKSSVKSSRASNAVPEEDYLACNRMLMKFGL